MQAKNLRLMGGIAGIIAAVAWSILVLMLIGAWGRINTLFTYEFLNGLLPVPHALMLLCIVIVYRSNRSGRRSETVGFWVTVVGLSLFIIGSAVEFWLGGGVRTGDKLFSNIGWFTYLFGWLFSTIGLITLGLSIAAFRFRFLVTTIGIVLGIWFPAIIVGELLKIDWLGTSILLVFGLGWLGLGTALTIQAMVERQEESV